ncbi:PREDICTED: uncharacterized protein LOC105362950 [Ceratosolen solmsi marchali]|uniref:Uncharacterized protein LOC105362950 n=1 Tax=Ceratosolen solmsi marchali TaxID=326594 RepID=A0AAJ6YIR0_9HYME|nr:PREDICTED: uncharacterized protein LOC105362950 [Ceratosolen solmsi marchali]
MRKEITYAQSNNPQRGVIDIAIKLNNRYTDTRMKKYYQAALLITAVVSLISLLFYRHEYNKLRYVLEVFNYFGKACPEVPKISCPKKFSLDLNEPRSAWQRLDDDLYIYSSYVIHNGKIETISYGKLISPNFDCNIFFNNLLTPIPGIFSFSIIGNTSDIPGRTAYRGYILVCEYTEYMIPVGVSFQQKDQILYNPNSSVFPINIQPKALTYNGSALCVAPPSNIPMSHTEMLSFLNFHELIGLNHFVIYDYGIPNVFHNGIKNMVQDLNPNWNFTYDVIQWNFPIRDIHPNIIRNIITTDCLYRTYKKVMYTATLSWDEYIVLKFHQIVSDLLIDFEKNKLFGNRFVIETQTFCIQQEHQKTSTTAFVPYILRKLYTSPNALNANFLYIYKPHEFLNVKNIQTLKAAAKLIIASRYVFCNDYNANNVEFNKYEPSILRFAKDITNSTIFQRYVSGKMFDLKLN